MIAQPNNVFGGNTQTFFFNFNQSSGVTLSDVVALPLSFSDDQIPDEWDASNILNNFIVMDIDIVDNNEVLLSCRDIIFACVKPDDSIVDELLAQDGTNGASVASFEYGINEAIPHSRGGELLCPGNIIGEGIVRLNLQGILISGDGMFPAYIGLNNGNGRGSMDAFWEESLVVENMLPPG